ncbi:hypothetical protein GCM10027416_00870 [Okibacterium endophyticum]
MTPSAEGLALMRRDARDELDVLIEHRCRAGEDPYVFLCELPTVDELVVAELHADALDARGLTAEYTMARHAGRSDRADAEHHRESTEKLDYELLREIALAHPELTTTIWRLIGTIGIR